MSGPDLQEESLQTEGRSGTVGLGSKGPQREARSPRSERSREWGRLDLDPTVERNGAFGRPGLSAGWRSNGSNELALSRGPNDPMSKDRAMEIQRLRTRARLSGLSQALDRVGFDQRGWLGSG